MNTLNEYIVIFYILFWVVRIRGCVRRVRQPLLRGPDWFFNVHVQPDFYTGAGKHILHRYWMRMLIPFVLDIPITMTIFIQVSSIRALAADCAGDLDPRQSRVLGGQSGTGGAAYCRPGGRAARR